jgi:hypothetical protein
MTTRTAAPRVPQAQTGLWGGADTPTEAIYDDDQVVEAAAAHWRMRGFPYWRLTLAECMDQVNRLALTPDVSLWGTDTAYHVADTYNPHRLHARAAGMLSPVDAFEDDALLRRTLRLLLAERQSVTALMSKLTIVSGTQGCANFRPGVALAMYRQYGSPGATILDPSIGYGGRLVGWMASGMGGRYVGIDPSKASVEGSRQMAHDLGFGPQITLINEPAEDVVLADDLIGNVDFAFTSPPYFTKERYAEGHDDESSQSWSRWPEPDAWLGGFLVPMVAMVERALRSGGHLALNVADVRIGSKVHPVTQWCELAASDAGLVRVSHDREMAMARRYGANQAISISTEPVLVWQKP